MIFKISKKLSNMEGYSIDSIYQILDWHFSKDFVIKMTSESLISFKKRYRYFHSRDFLDSLDLINSGSIKFFNDKVVIQLLIIRQLIYSILFGSTMIFIFYKVFNKFFIIGIILISILMIILWIRLLMTGFDFLKDIGSKIDIKKPGANIVYKP